MLNECEVTEVSDQWEEVHLGGLVVYKGLYLKPNIVYRGPGNGWRERGELRKL